MNNKNVNIGINGLGRIGRAIFHNLIENPLINIASVNEANNNIENICYTLNYDSTYGLRNPIYKPVGNHIVNIQNGKTIRVFNKKNIQDVAWLNHDVKILIDSSGLKVNEKFLKVKKLRNIYKIQTNSDNNNAKHLIHGVNEKSFKKKLDFDLSSSICDSVAISPVIMLLKKFKILSGSITTVHPLLNYQHPLDSKSASWSNPGSIYGHFELGRGFVNNIIPKPTSALSAVSKIFGYDIEKKISSFSYRVPTTIVGSADMTINIQYKLTKKEFLNEINKLNSKYKKDIIKVSNNKLTSLDFIKNENCCVLDTRWFSVRNFKNHSILKIILWYDNEWGYSNKVSDLVNYIASLIK